jgi:hypothetical protein
MPSWPIEMPSDTEVVPNSIGKPPAWNTPSLAALARRCRDRLHGVISSHDDATPIWFGEVLVTHACRAQHSAGGGLLQAVGDVTSAGLHIGSFHDLPSAGVRVDPRDTAPVGFSGWPRKAVPSAGQIVRTAPPFIGGTISLYGGSGPRGLGGSIASLTIRYSAAVGAESWFLGLSDAAIRSPGRHESATLHSLRLRPIGRRL